MSQTRFNMRATVMVVRRLTDHRVEVEALGVGDEQVRVSFKMRTGNRNDAPRVNDDLLVTITTPAPSDGGPPDD